MTVPIPRHPPLPVVDPTQPRLFQRILQAAAKARRQRAGREDVVRAERRDAFMRRMRAQQEPTAK